MKTIFNFLGIFTLTTLVLITDRAHALPLLSESAALQVAANLTLYPDDKDPNKFYFFPNSSHFALDDRERPVFSYTYWGLDNPSATDVGAYMVFDLRLTSDPKQQVAMESFLKTHPGSGIAVLPVKSSTLTIDKSAGATQPPLTGIFKELNLQEKAGRAEDEIGGTAILTPVGAKVLRATILATNTPLTINYRYKIEGLGPNFDAEIHVKMDRVYDYFQASASGGYLWWSASITKVIETLIQQNLITIKINGGDAKDKEYVEAIAEKMVQRLFVPELSASPSVSGGGSPGAGSTFGGWFSLNVSSVHKQELKEEVWSLTQRDIVEREFGIAVSMRDLDKYADQLVVNADQAPGGRK